MSRGPNGSRPFLDVVLAYWPLLIFVPAVLVLITVLVLVTRWWDKRDEQARAAEVLPFRPRGAPVAAPAKAAARSGGRMQRRWLGRTRCTCSWHTGQATAARTHQAAGH